MIVTLLLAVAYTFVNRPEPAAAPSTQLPNQSQAAEGAAPGVAAPEAAQTRTAYLPMATSQPQAAFGAEMSPISASGGLTQMADAGASWLRRSGIWWPDVQPTETAYNWSALSGMEVEFRNAAARNIRLIVIVRGTPAWAQQYPGVSCGPIKRDKLAAFGRFMYELTNRYSRPPYNVMHWEIWNEPDIAPALVPPNSLWGCWGDNNDAYYGGGYFADMLKAVYPEVKRANPQANVLVGGLLMDCNPANPPAGKDCKPSKFLEGILRNGGGAYFDGVAFHAYDYYDSALGRYSNSNWQAASGSTGPVIAAKANYIKGLLSTYGAAGKYLMNTESAILWGCPGGCTADFEWTKAYYVAHAYGMAISLNLKANVWYSVLGWPGRNTALLRSNLTPYPAYYAFKAGRAMLGGATPIGPITPSDVGGAAGVAGYKFNRSGKIVWLIWSRDNAGRTVALPKTPAAVWDVLGNSLPASASLAFSTPGRLLAYVEFRP